MTDSKLNSYFHQYGQAVTATRSNWKKNIQKQVLDYVRFHPHLSQNLFAESASSFFGYNSLFRYSLITICSMLMVLLPVQAVSAQQTRPGQWLYPIKRLMETSQWMLTLDEQARTQLKKQFALNRVYELEQSILLEDDAKYQDQAAMHSKESVQQLLDEEPDRATQDTLMYVHTKLAAVKTQTQSTGIVEVIEDLEKTLQDAQIPTFPMSCPDPENNPAVQGTDTQATASAQLVASPAPSPSVSPAPSPTPSPTPSPLSLIISIPTPQPISTTQATATPIPSTLTSPGPSTSPTPQPTDGVSIATQSGTSVLILFDNQLDLGTSLNIPLTNPKDSVIQNTVQMLSNPSPLEILED